MKLIVAGASGFVAAEVLRQSLRLREITTVVALARRTVEPPESTAPADAAKLRSVIIKDYEEYPDDVRKEFADADACIWTVAITPSKSKLIAADELTRVCHTCTLAGIRAMVESRPAKPFRFIYLSGLMAERDQTKRPMIMADYLLMRGETENRLLSFPASQPPGSVEICVAKPGLVTNQGGGIRSVLTTAMRWTGIVPNIAIEELVAAILKQVRNGIEKEPLLNDELKRIGQEVLAEQARNSQG